MAARGFAQIGAEAVHLARASADRFRDAEVLLGADRFASAIVMGIYALEIRLKVNVCNRLDLDGLPMAFQIHNLADLLTLAGLSRRLERVAYLRVKANWDFVISKYGESQINNLRYGNHGEVDRADAAGLLQRIGHTDPGEGLLRWLSIQT